MFKMLCKSLTPLLLLAAVPAMADEPVMSKFKMTLGGYVKLDYAHNTNPSGWFTDPRGAAAGVHKDESIFTAKQSRIWFKVAGPEFLGAKTRALIEADFNGANSLANEFGNMRMRHAYGSLDWNTTQVLFGQFWDVFGPAGGDTIDFRQSGDTGCPANPRVPQIRLTQNLKLSDDNGLKFVLAVQNPVQNSATGTVTSPGTGGGANAYPGAVPNSSGSWVNAAGQIMFSSKALGVSPGFMGLGMNPFQVGVFGLAGNEKVPGSKSVDVYGYGFYGFVPLVKSSDGKSRTMTLSLETQATMSAGMNIQSAAPIALVGPANARSGAKSYTLYGQLKFYPTQELGITAGYGRRGAVDHDAYRATTTAATTFQKYNELSYANLTYDLNAAVRLATEFEHHVTQYDRTTTTVGSNYGQNNVFRLAAYYFF